MTQMDNIRNTDFIPTEEDLEGLIKVVDALPGACAELFGMTYYLNGSSDPNYSKSHVYKCTKNEDGQYVWTDLDAGRYSVGSCKNIRLMMFDDGESFRVIISWEDPDDLIIGSEKILWKETRLVYQVGHMPVDVNDGTLVVTNTTRNKYKEFGSFGFSFTGDSSRKYYFKLFPVSEDNAVTNDDVNGRCAGYNYAVCTDAHPYTRTGSGTNADPFQYSYKTFYRREVDATTGIASYIVLELTDSEYFTPAYSYNVVTGTFKSGTSYYIKNGTNYVLLTEGVDYNVGDNIPTNPAIYTQVTYYEFKSGTTYYEYKNCFATWAGIQELIKNGEAENYFPIGTVISAPYHGDFNEIAFEVVDYDSVQPYDPSVLHTMTLQSKYLPLWWDYNGGVVFDTNERLGVLSPNTVKNDKSRTGYKTIYFKQMKGAVTSETNSSELTMQWVAVGDKGNGGVAAHENDGWDGDPNATGAAVYVATIWDETDHVYDQDELGQTHWQPGMYYECELPYTTDDGVARTTQGMPAFDPSICPLLAKTSPTATPTEIYPSGGILNNSYDCASGKTGEKYRSTEGHGDWLKMASGWGPTIHANSQKYVRYAYAPRDNKYADRYASVQPQTLAGICESTAKRVWFPDIKYYVPTETKLSRWCNLTTSATADAVTYTSRRYIPMRDCTEDLEKICQPLLDAEDETYTFIGDDGNRYVDLTKVCQDLFHTVTNDEVFMGKRKYWLMTYELISGTWDESLHPHDAWYYTLKADVKATTSGITSPDHSSYCRCRRGNNGDSIPANTYKGVPVALEAGVDYDVGQVVPITNRTPHFCVQKEITDATGTFGTLESGKTYAKASRHLANYYVSLVEGDTTDISAGTYKLGDEIPAGVKIMYTPPVPEASSGTDYLTNGMCWSINGGFTRFEDTFGDLKDYYGANLGAKDYKGYCNQNTEAKTVSILETDIHAQVCSVMNDIGSDVDRYTCCLYYFMPNAERVIYGNHVWAQSNVRMYLNGPFDDTTEYMRPPERNFLVSSSYFIRDGAGWKQLKQTATKPAAGATSPGDTFYGGAISTFPTSTHKTVNNPGESIAAWEEANHATVYCKYNGGMPVGCKLDRYNYSRYITYGISPRQQYREINDEWKPVFDTNDLWWKPQQSVNNIGVSFDRLAAQYWENSILGPDATTAGKAAVYPGVLKRVDYVNGTSAPCKTFDETHKIAKYGDHASAYVLPRQSFLHGFIDCRYKRTGDLTKVDGKTYYYKNPYGEYEDASLVYPSNVYDVATFNPYRHVLYEVNGSFNSDLQDAYEFLNAIQPVVNRNGLYGTTAARDFFSHELHAANGDKKFGCTLSIDKVWLCSTAQVAGGDGVNNTVYESWIANPKFDEWASEVTGTGTSYYDKNIFALRKWRQAVVDFVYYGKTDLKGTRVKIGYTSNAHASSAYSDANAGACYWWLRSAGDPVSTCQHMRVPDNTGAITIHIFSPKSTEIRLSPLITLG